MFSFRLFAYDAPSKDKKKKSEAPPNGTESAPANENQDDNQPTKPADVKDVHPSLKESDSGVDNAKLASKSDKKIMSENSLDTESKTGSNESVLDKRTSSSTGYQSEDTSPENEEREIAVTVTLENLGSSLTPTRKLDTLADVSV